MGGLGKVLVGETPQGALQLLGPELRETHPLLADRPVAQTDGAVAEQGDLPPAKAAGAVEAQHLDRPVGRSGHGVAGAGGTRARRAGGTRGQRDENQAGSHAPPDHRLPPPSSPPASPPPPTAKAS